MATLTRGTRLGRYVVHDLLGAGGMAQVYLGEDPELGRRVALKVLPPETAGDERAQRRLVREARAAAVLEHPHICAVYEVDQADGRVFVAMQYIEGETLEARIRRSPPTLDDALQLCVQIVDGVAEAHARGILHRDLKPGNVMVTSRGQVKVMDFGLAKTADTLTADGAASTVSVLSTPGMVLGTWAYMSPEQVRGEPLDQRSDIFSLGIVIYELVAGRRPFDDGAPAAVASAILSREPAPLARFAPDVPVELERIVGKALRKPVEARYQTAKDLLVDLRALKEERDFQDRLRRTPPPEPGLAPAPPATEAALPAPPSSSAGPSAVAPSSRRGKRAALATGLVLLAAAVAGGAYTWRAGLARREAEAALPRIVALADEGRLFEAYDLARAAEAVLGDDARLAGIWPAVANTLTVTTEPAGARVTLERFAPGQQSPRQELGVTPLSNVRIARGDYIMRLEKEGALPVERSLTARNLRSGDLRLPAPPLKLSFQLARPGDVPPRMVPVPGGRYRLTSWERPTDRAVDLAGFFIDKFEVTNAEFQEFVSAGGYLKREFWREPMTKDGRPLSFEDAVRLFVDRSGLPGPRGWTNQSPPEGKADHPVAGVAWYEAAAYAAFRGKRLPTMFQWEKAARGAGAQPALFTGMPWGVVARGEDVALRANFAGTGTLPVTALAFGMSPYGAYHMAGNVAEWTRSETPDGYIAVGGGWADPVYTFGQFGPRPATYASETIGFRLVQPDPASSADDGSGRIEVAKEVPKYVAIPEARFRTLAEAYRYAPTPLDARIEATDGTADYTRETVSFTGVDATRVTGYLYLPRHVPRPLQVLHYVPGGDVSGGVRPLTASMDERMVPFVKAGRAAFGVMLRGYLGGPPYEGPRPDYQSVEYLESMVERVNTLRRALDYLGSRPDIDQSRIVFLGPSAGAKVGLIEAALEDRYRAVVMIGAGLERRPVTYHPAADPVHFTPFIRAAKLILQGRYDEDTPLLTSSQPMFDLMRPPKQMIVYDGTHVPTVEVQIRVVGEWLDQQLGPVTR